jgi:hypothetical protein
MTWRAGSPSLSTTALSAVIACRPAISRAHQASARPHFEHGTGTAPTGTTGSRGRIGCGVGGESRRRLVLDQSRDRAQAFFHELVYNHVRPVLVAMLRAATPDIDEFIDGTFRGWRVFRARPSGRRSPTGRDQHRRTGPPSTRTAERSIFHTCAERREIGICGTNSP